MKHPLILASIACLFLASCGGGGSSTSSSTGTDSSSLAIPAQVSVVTAN
jgi:hypothetical protein